MSYTVKQLAKSSGVSVRTLHYYDEIGLLKPAYYGDNHYRYYEEEQLLLLQQILFYKALGFSLEKIKQALHSKQFNKISALRAHRKSLKSDLKTILTLIKTIDKTINHLEGNKMVNLEDIFAGFTDEMQHHYEKSLIKSGVSKEALENSKVKVKNWSKEQWLENKQQNDKVYSALARAIHEGLAPHSDQVQALIAQHYALTKVFWTPTQKTYIGLSQLYQSHPDFIEFYHNIHPKLLDFLVTAMQIFADRKLS